MMRLIKEKGSQNTMYDLKYSSLEDKYFGANLIKIGWEIRNILYFNFYIISSMGAVILNI